MGARINVLKNVLNYHKAFLITIKSLSSVAINLESISDAFA